ncbi:MAG: HD domain-containing protein [Bacillota bacterium]
MNGNQLNTFREWFRQYVGNCYNNHPQHEAWIRLKENHTFRVCEKIVRIGQSLNLPDEDICLADTIGLFHDVGRFRQIERYRTFNDSKSENHATLGIKVLEEAGVLLPLQEKDQQLIKKAIELHNLRDLPDSLPDRCLLFARLIRDADKLDILEVFTRYYTAKNNEYSSALDSYLPDTPGYSPILINNILSGERCNYSDIKNRNDRKLLNLSWVYDINFTHTLSEILKNGYIDKIIGTLPATGDIKTIHKNICAYSKERLEASSQAADCF